MILRPGLKWRMNTCWRILQKRPKNFWRKIQPFSCQFYHDGISWQQLFLLHFFISFMDTSWLVHILIEDSTLVTLCTILSVSWLNNLGLNFIGLSHAYFSQRPFLDRAEHLTEDAVSVFPAAESLEQYVMMVIASACGDDAVDTYCKQKLTLYQVC